MNYLDEKIARLQKNNQTLLNYKEESQSEAVECDIMLETDEYEATSWFKDKITTQIPKDFFKVQEMNAYEVFLNAEKKLSIVGVCMGLENEIPSLEENKQEIEAFSKKEDIYVEIVEAVEKNENDLKTYDFKLRIPIALGYVVQVQRTLYTKEEVIQICFTYLETMEKSIGPIVDYIIAHLQVKGDV